MLVSSRLHYLGSKGCRFVWLVSLVFALNPVSAPLAKQETHCYRLQKDLLANYSSAVRPVLDASTTTTISINVVILSINDIDEATQTLTHMSYIDFKWFDELLKWDPQEYGGLKSVEIFAKQVWLPFMESINSASGSTGISPSDLTKVIVKSSGEVTWFHHEMWTTMCPMDATYFPFDSQQCNLSVSMWTSTISEVMFSNISHKRDEFFIEHGEWMVQSLDTAIVDSFYDKEAYAGFTVRFQLKRRRMFYTLTLIVPNVLLALLASTVYIVPVKDGEKMTFISGLLVTTGVNMTVLVNSMPLSSLNISYLMIYVLALSMATGLALASSACIICCWWSEEDVGPKTTLLVTFLCKLTRHKKRSLDHGALGSKQDKPLSREATASQGRQVDLTWKDVAVVLDKVCFCISVSVVVGITLVLFVVLWRGSA